MRLKKEMELGAGIPKYFGVTKWDHDKRICICWFIPLNLIIRCFNAIYSFVKYPIEAEKALNYMNWKQRIKNFEEEANHETD